MLDGILSHPTNRPSWRNSYQVIDGLIHHPFFFPPKIAGKTQKRKKKKKKKPFLNHQSIVNSPNCSNLIVFCPFFLSFGPKESAWRLPAAPPIVRLLLLSIYPPPSLRSTTNTPLSIDLVENAGNPYIWFPSEASSLAKRGPSPFLPVYSLNLILVFVCFFFLAF